MTMYVCGWAAVLSPTVNECDIYQNTAHDVRSKALPATFFHGHKYRVRDVIARAALTREAYRNPSRYLKQARVESSGSCQGWDQCEGQRVRIRLSVGMRIRELSARARSVASERRVRVRRLRTRLSVRLGFALA